MSGRVGFFILRSRRNGWRLRFENHFEKGAKMIAKKSRLASKGIRIAIVDDHPSVRDGLRMLLDREPGLEVCGEAGSVAEALKLIASESPDISIVDISLGDDNSLDLIRRLKARNSSVRILVWSMYDDLVYAERALAAGAMGYISKQEATAKIFVAIQKLMDGRVYVSEKMANHMLTRSIGGRPREDLAPIATLSDRELQVFRLIGGGTTTAEISRALHISVKTVETHRQRIKDKLQIVDAPKLVREATQWVLENG
jgi:DNA-binding NarL/FixJ family response regulator